MLKILICECKQEISSFNPMLSRYSDFVISIGRSPITVMSSMLPMTLIFPPHCSRVSISIKHSCPFRHN